MVYILCKIYYDDEVVYLGRTKQPLQNRIREHVFKRPLVRAIEINKVSRIEYAEFASEADMNLYEIYYINKIKPRLNKDDKAKDGLTIELPEVHWRPFEILLWDKWKKKIALNDQAIAMQKAEIERHRKLVREMRSKWHSGEISEDDYYAFKEQNMEQL